MNTYDREALTLRRLRCILIKNGGKPRNLCVRPSLDAKDRKPDLSARPLEENASGSIDSTIHKS
jgi:hypothetical protein